MTLEEAGKIIGILEFNYPDTRKNMSDDAYITFVRLWHSFFAEESAELVEAAVRAYIAASPERFAPNIGQIKEQIRKLTQPEPMSEVDAWALISNALKNSYYGAESEYAKLPPILQRLVGSPEQLRVWGLMDTDTVQSVVASNVMRSYRTLLSRETEMSKLPVGYRERMQQLAGGVFKPLELEEGDYEGT